MAAQPGTISVDASSNTTLCARWFGAPFMPCFLGLAALRVWLQVNEFGGYAQSDNGIITILSNLTYGLTFLIAATVAWRKPPTPRTEHAIAFIAAALMLVTPLLMLAGLAPNAGAVATAGALLVGVAGAFGGGMWACAYTRSPRWRSARSAGLRSASCPRGRAISPACSCPRFPFYVSSAPARTPATCRLVNQQATATAHPCKQTPATNKAHRQIRAALRPISKRPDASPVPLRWQQTPATNKPH